MRYIRKIRREGRDNGRDVSGGSGRRDGGNLARQRARARDERLTRPEVYPVEEDIQLHRQRAGVDRKEGLRRGRGKEPAREGDTSSRRRSWDVKEVGALAVVSVCR
jgi:hypothetical protein